MALQRGDEITIVRPAPKVPRQWVGVRGEILGVSWPNYVVHMGTCVLPRVPYWAVKREDK